MDYSQLAQAKAENRYDLYVLPLTDKDAAENMFQEIRRQAYIDALNDVSELVEFTRNIRDHQSIIGNNDRSEDIPDALRLQAKDLLEQFEKIEP